MCDFGEKARRKDDLGVYKRILFKGTYETGWCGMDSV
jgi:hypothetical protein